MERPKGVGGLSLPNLHTYYWAANFNAISLWLNDWNDRIPAWLQIEKVTSSPYSLPALLCAPLPSLVNNIKDNIIVTQSLRIANQFKRCLGIQSISIHSPIIRNHLFQPSLLDNGFKMWYDKGIHSIEDLYVNNTFASFEQLSKKFGLTNNHFLRYLQIRDFTRKRFANFPSLPPPSCLDSLLRVNRLNKSRISFIYSHIMDSCNHSISHIREQWENDLGIQLSDEEWDMALTRVHSSSVRSRRALIQFKVLHRLHFSKARLARIFQNVDPLCDRCKQTPATSYHMFWSCTKLVPFWSSFFEVISNAYAYNISPSPLVAVFGWFSDAAGSVLPVHLQRVIAFSSLLARRLILFKWKAATPPSHHHWIRDVMQNLKLEKIRCTLNGSINRFHKTWDPLITYVNNLPGLDLELWMMTPALEQPCNKKY